MIGPHEGIEFELMMSGKKPLGYFSDEGVRNWKPYPEEDFDKCVQTGTLLKRAFSNNVIVNGKNIEIQNVLYAVPREGWRIDAFILVDAIYRSPGHGWRPDLERVIGALLGYAPEQVEHFIARHGRRDAPDDPAPQPASGDGVRVE